MRRTCIVRIGKSRGIIGAEVQAFDNLKKEADGLLIPFRTGEVKILNVISDKITLNNSDFSHEDLFLEMKETNKSNVLDLVDSRIESGFYNRVLTKSDYIVDDKYKVPSYNPTKIDGPTLVYYLNEAGIVKRTKTEKKVDIPNQSKIIKFWRWVQDESRIPV